MIRSIAAIIAGYLVMAISIVGLFAAWFGPQAGVPARGFLIYSLVYGFFVAITGGYVTALVAGRAELKHAVGLAVLAAIAALISAVMYAGREPLWYQFANLVVVTDGALLGGFVRHRQRQRLPQS
ncbi:MAG: hypothetical protein ABR543_19045 [Gemmatimonadaceae bacterium]